MRSRFRFVGRSLICASRLVIFAKCRSPSGISENRSTKRKRKRTQENKREPRDEPKELKEPKNDAAQQEQTQEKVETDPPPEENKGDARRKQTQTRECMCEDCIEESYA